MADLTINALAAELGVSRRTIERALEAGELVPTRRTTGGRVRFGPDLVERLKARAVEARSAGRKYPMLAVFSADTDMAPRRKRKSPPLSAQDWARRTIWKLQNLSRSRSRSSNDAGPAATEHRKGSPPAFESVATPAPGAAAADVAARKARAAAANKSSRLSGLIIRGLAGRPTSRERAVAMLRAIENVARHEPGADAEHIRKTAARLGHRLKRHDPDKQDVLELRGLLPCAMQLDREQYHFLATALPNLIAWCEAAPLQS